MIEYKWVKLTSEYSEIHRCVRDIMGTVVQRTKVGFNWNHKMPIPPDENNYYETVYLSLE